MANLRCNHPSESNKKGLKQLSLQGLFLNCTYIMVGLYMSYVINDAWIMFVVLQKLIDFHTFRSTLIGKGLHWVTPTSGKKMQKKKNKFVVSIRCQHPILDFPRSFCFCVLSNMDTRTFVVWIFKDWLKSQSCSIKVKSYLEILQSQVVVPWRSKVHSQAWDF